MAYRWRRNGVAEQRRHLAGRRRSPRGGRMLAYGGMSAGLLCSSNVGGGISVCVTAAHNGGGGVCRRPWRLTAYRWRQAAWRRRSADMPVTGSGGSRLMAGVAA